MRCSVCGRESRDLDTQYRSVGGGSKGGGARFVPYMICADCANYRRGTVRLVYRMAIAVAGFIILAILLSIVSSL